MLKRHLLIAILILLWTFASNAQVPQLINYQALLTDATGNPIDGSRTIQFKIYPTETAGSEEWSEIHTVTASNGLFSVMLGSFTPIPYTLFDGNDKYLSLKVENDPEMTPRKRLVSVGYAFQTYNADKVDGKDASEFIQKGEVNSISSDMIQDDAVTTAKISPNVISSINSVSNDGGNIDLVEGNNVTITPDDANNRITISATTTGGGDNLGNHTATQNINLNGHWLSGDGDSEGIYVKDEGNVGIGTTNPTAQFHVSGINGALFEGIFNNGTIPKEGPGARMMWYPAKAAFRVGHLDVPNGNFWDDDSIGNGSIAMGGNTVATGLNSIALGMATWARNDGATSMGFNTLASGHNSTAMGQRTKAVGHHSTAMGSRTIASGTNSTAMGGETTASGEFSTAMGEFTMASGRGSLSIGYGTRARGLYSFAAGEAAKANHSGCFVWSGCRVNLSDSIASTNQNQFIVRAPGGVYFYSDVQPTVGVLLNPGASSWSSISDSTKKENFKLADGEDILRKISNFNLGTWNYKGQEPTKYRHYGPMAQDFYAAFGCDGIGTIGNDTTLSSADFNGINFITIQALEKRTTALRNQISDLKMENEQLKTELDQMKSVITDLSESLLKLQAQSTLGNEARGVSEVVKLTK
jgi:hypothetical protein